MTPEGLIRRIPFILPERRNEANNQAATELGNELRQRYRELAHGFRAIAKCAGGRQTNPGLIWTPSINLGVVEHRQQGRMACSARLAIAEYNAAQLNSNFSVQTIFAGRGEDGHVGQLDCENFGARHIDFIGNHVPTFVANPDCTCADPWDIRGETTFRWPMLRTWTMATYREIDRTLSPMLEQATDTQTLLINAMRDPQLNPQMAEQAMHLTIPGQTSVSS